MKTEIHPAVQLTELAFCKQVLDPIGVRLDVEKVLSKTRDSEVVFGRALCSVILYEKGYTLPKIGGILNKDHASVHHLLYGYQHKENSRSEKFREIRHIVIEGTRKCKTEIA